MQLEGKRAIVTGAASGQGAATVRAFAREGARVIALDVNDGPGQQVAAAAGETVRYMHCDVSNRAEVEAAFQDAVHELGGLDVLAHAAGIWRRSMASDPDEGIWDLLFQTNLRGTLYANWAAMPAMRASGGGSIINFGSGAGMGGGGDAVAYGATKAAVHSWTRSISQEWKQYGIRANAVLPVIQTPMAAQAVEARKALGLLTPEQAQIDPSHRPGFGDPDRDLAPVVVFLASEASRFISGQLIPVDGGSLMVR